MTDASTPSTRLLEEARVRFSVLTGEEKHLLQEINSRGIIFNSSWWDDNKGKPAVDGSDCDLILSSEFVRWLCLFASKTEKSFRSIEIFGARISGDLDFASMEITLPLRLRKCYFDDSIILMDCKSRTLDFSQSRLVSLFADRLQVLGP